MPSIHIVAFAASSTSARRRLASSSAEGRPGTANSNGAHAGMTALPLSFVGAETEQVPTEITALVVPMPEADPVVGRFRRALDSGAAAGVPAHVTVVYPFMPVEQVDRDVLRHLRDLFVTIEEFECSLASIAWFDRSVMYLRPEPDVPLRRMTRLVVERWPQWPPYGGAHRDPTPHLTIADNGDDDAMRRAAAIIGAELPLDIVVSEVHLYAGSSEPGSWHHLQTLPLRPRSTSPVAVI